jgi:beta-galactosidase
VDHCGHENTRTFREVAEIGSLLESLEGLAETLVETQVAILHDWEAMYALTEDNGILNDLFHNKPAGYKRAFMPYYRALVENRVAVDFVPPDGTWWEGKKLIVAPMWYLVREEQARRAEEFVQAGGILVTTYWSGVVGANGLCHLGGVPGPLRHLMGIWVEETSSMQTHRSLGVRLGAGDEFQANQFADSIHLEGAEALATFTSGIFAGQPAATSNRFGKGRAIHLGARFPLSRLRSFFSTLLDEQTIPRTFPADLPPGVYATRRKGTEGDFIFLMNFSEEPQTAQINSMGIGLPAGEPALDSVCLAPYGLRILRPLA